MSSLPPISVNTSVVLIHISASTYQESSSCTSWRHPDIWVLMYWFKVYFVIVSPLPSRAHRIQFYPPLYIPHVVLRFRHWRSFNEFTSWWRYSKILLRRAVSKLSTSLISAIVMSSSRTIQSSSRGKCLYLKHETGVLRSRILPSSNPLILRRWKGDEGVNAALVLRLYGWTWSG